MSRPLTLLAVLLLALPGQAQDAASAPASLPTVAAGQALLSKGDYAAAEEVFRARTESQPGEAVSWYFLGFALHAQGDLGQAIPVHEKAASFTATAPAASYNAACAHAKLGHIDQAFQWLTRATQTGFGDRKLLATDDDLEPLRSDPRFDLILPPLLEGSELFVEQPRVLHTMVGEARDDEFGWVARVVGDLDADGVADFAATAPGHAGTGRQAGRVSVYSSRSGERLFVFDGAAGWRLGNSVAGRVDVDADGMPDVIVGAPGTSALPGRAFVYSGADGSQLHMWSPGEAGDQFGLKVCGLEDLDGDGHAEVAVTASKADTVAGSSPGTGSGTAKGGGTDAGRVTVFSGASGDELFRIEGDATGAQFGSAVDGTRAGGHHLLAVGAMRGGPRATGQALVYRCTADGAELAFTIDSDAKGANLGQYFVTFLGDVDGDEVPDVYASDWNHGVKGPATGQVYVHSGASGERLLTIDGHVQGEGFGTSAADCGDVNGDGHADLVVGAWQNSEGAPSAGKCYLHSGADGSLLATWTSKQGGDTLGFDAVGIGDVDGDGHHDFLLTSAWSTVDARKQGRVFIVAGPDLGGS